MSNVFRGIRPALGRKDHFSFSFSFSFSTHSKTKTHHKK